MVLLQVVERFVSLLDDTWSHISTTLRLKKYLPSSVFSCAVSSLFIYQIRELSHLRPGMHRGQSSVRSY